MDKSTQLFCNQFGSYDDGTFIGEVVLSQNALTKFTPEVMENLRLEYLKNVNENSIAIANLLKNEEAWGINPDTRKLPEVPFSEDFWTSCIGAIFDKECYVRMQPTPNITCAFVSETLTRQISDILTTLGIPNRKHKRVKSIFKFPILEIRIYSKGISQFVEMIPIKDKKKVEVITEILTTHCGHTSTECP
jgi:hypothetical protein